MFLYLDANQSRFAFFQEDSAYPSLAWHEIPKDSSLPRLIAPALAEPLRGIVVEQGSGSFSQSREAVVFANIYGQTRRVPVISISQPTEDLKALVENLQTSDTYVIEPVYSGEPNISI